MFKSILTVAAVLSVAAPAMASKARLASLQNAPHLVDTQSMFDNPAKTYLMGDFATLEFGATSTAANGVNTPENFITNGNSAIPATTFYSPNAEGGFVRSYGDSKVGFYMGRKSAFTTRVRSLLGFTGQENPVEFMYGFQAGDVKMAASFNYSKSDKKDPTGPQKQEAMGLRFGAVATNWDAAITFGLASKATGNAAVTNLTAADTDSEYKGTTGFKVNGGYWFENTYVFANYYQDGVELSNMTGVVAFAGVTDAKIEQSQYEIGVIDTIKADGVNFFYGVSYIGFTSDDKEDNAAVDARFKAEQTQLPFVVGVEADAASWLVLRASVKQNVILGSTKENGGDSVTNENNTTVALGAGIKFNKFMLDSTLAAGSVPADPGSGNINANDLMANASLTYMF